MPAILIVDDDESITEYLRSRFHEETSLGVLVANALSDAREILESTDTLEIDAVVADLHFNEAFKDPTNSLFGGLDILKRAQLLRPEALQYVFSVWSERDAERERASQEKLPVRRWMQKLFHAPADPGTPWADIAQDVVAEALVARGAGDGGLAQAAAAVVTLPFPRRTYLQFIPVDVRTVRLMRPLPVICTAAPDGSVSARAEGIGLFADGSGDTVDEAIEDLASLVVDQWELLRRARADLLQEYTRGLLERLNAFIPQDLV